MVIELIIHFKDLSKNSRRFTYSKPSELIEDYKHVLILMEELSDVRITLNNKLSSYEDIKILNLLYS